MEEIFSKEENRLLSTWFQLSGPEYDVDQGADPQVLSLLVPDAWGRIHNWSLSHTVARLLLEGVQERLPQWAVVHADNSVLLGRKAIPRTSRKTNLYPQLLFEINWGDSGPGFSWPQAYNLTYVPIYDRHVVTVSVDSPEALWGYTDLALGHFSAGAALIDNVKNIIRSWWGMLRDFNLEPWSDFWHAGLVSEEQAKEWRNEVWPPPQSRKKRLTQACEGDARLKWMRCGHRHQLVLPLFRVLQRAHPMRLRVGAVQPVWRGSREIG